MSWNLKGVPVHGEFSSSNASALSEANSRFAMYPAGVVTGASAITLNAAGSNSGLDNLLADVVIVTDLTITVGAAITVSIYDGANNAVDAGELIARTTLVLGTSISIRLFVPHYCAPGTYPKVLTSATGQVDVVFHGMISSAGF